MKSKVLKRVITSFLAAAMLFTTVPVLAANDVKPEAKVVSAVEGEEEILVKVEMGKLKSIDTCKPTLVSTGLGDYEYYKLTPGYGIEQHELTLYVECPHESGYVKITEDMCSYYQSDWLDEILPVKVTYNGVTVELPVMYTYGLPFVDVKASDWFYDSVDLVYANEIMTGMSDTVFGPYESLSRAQFAVIVYRLEGSPEYTSTKVFPDVPAGSWFEDAVLWAYEMEIINGYENGYFGPADLITREQMAVMIYRYLTAFADASGHADLGRFKDANRVSPFATEAFAWAVGNGIITGKDNGVRLAPMETAARAECAVIVDRFVNWILENYA